MNLLRSLSCLVFLTACDVGPMSAVGLSTKEGTRLKIRGLHYVADDGASILTAPQGFYDSKNNIECSMMMAEDGKVRCLPAGATPHYFHFADSQCKVALVVVARCDDKTPDYARIQQVGPQCGGQIRTAIHEIGQSTEGPLYYNSGSGCTRLSDASLSTLLASYRAYAVAGAVDPSTFVPGQVRDVFIE